MHSRQQVAKLTASITSWPRDSSVSQIHGAVGWVLDQKSPGQVSILLPIDLCGAEKHIESHSKVLILLGFQCSLSRVSPMHSLFPSSGTRGEFSQLLCSTFSFLGRSPLNFWQGHHSLQPRTKSWASKITGFPHSFPTESSTFSQQKHRFTHTHTPNGLSHFWKQNCPFHVLLKAQFWPV